MRSSYRDWQFVSFGEAVEACGRVVRNSEEIVRRGPLPIGPLSTKEIRFWFAHGPSRGFAKCFGDLEHFHFTCLRFGFREGGDFLRKSPLCIAVSVNT